MAGHLKIIRSYKYYKYLDVIMTLCVFLKDFLS